MGSVGTENNRQKGIETANGERMENLGTYEEKRRMWERYNSSFLKAFPNVNLC